MKDNFLKKILMIIYLRPNTIHRVLTGPLKSMRFRVNKVTGLSPIYSGGERNQQRVIAQLLKEGSVFIDIGANWGVHTLYASRLVGASGKVVSIEPFFPAFEELRWHTRENHCLNTILLNVAIYDKDTSAVLLSTSGGGMGVLSEYVINNTNYSNKNMITARSLDSIVSELHLHRIDVIKVDVEGAEDKFLEGAEKAITMLRPHIILELHNPQNDLFVGKWFTQRRYRLKRIAPSGQPITRIDKGWPHKDGIHGTVLASP